MSGRPPEPAEDDDLRRELERSPTRHDTLRAVSQRRNQPESGTSGWAGRSSIGSCTQSLADASSSKASMATATKSTDTTAADAAAGAAEQSEAQLRARRP
jgi:hypothetical protein